MLFIQVDFKEHLAYSSRRQNWDAGNVTYNSKDAYWVRFKSRFSISPLSLSLFPSPFLSPLTPKITFFFLHRYLFLSLNYSKSSLKFNFKSNYVWLGVWTCLSWPPSDHQRRTCGGLFFSHVALRDHSEVIRFGSKHLSPLSHLPGPSVQV